MVHYGAFKGNDQGNSIEERLFLLEKKQNIFTKHGVGADVTGEIGYIQEGVDDLTRIVTYLSQFPKTKEYQTWSEEMRQQIYSIRNSGNEILYSQYISILCNQLNRLNEEFEADFNEIREMYDNSDEIANILNLRKEAVLQLRYLAQNLTADFAIDVSTAEIQNDSWTLSEEGIEVPEEEDEENISDTHFYLFHKIIGASAFPKADRVKVNNFLRKNIHLSIEEKFKQVVSLDLSKKSKGILHIWWNTGIGYGGIVKRAGQYLELFEDVDNSFEESLNVLLDIFNGEEERSLDEKVRALFTPGFIDYNSVERTNTTNSLNLLLEYIETVDQGISVKELFLSIDKRKKIQTSYLKIYLATYPGGDLEALVQSIHTAIDSLKIQQPGINVEISEELNTNDLILSIAKKPRTIASIPWMDNKVMSAVLATWSTESVLVGRLDVVLRNIVFKLSWNLDLSYPRPEETNGIFTQVEYYVNELRNEGYDVRTWGQLFTYMHRAQANEKSIDSKVGSNVRGRSKFEAPMMKALESLINRRIGLEEYPVTYTIDGVVEQIFDYYSSKIES